jgi:hypothetical protein
MSTGYEMQRNGIQFWASEEGALGTVYVVGLQVTSDWDIIFPCYVMTTNGAEPTEV